MANTKIRVFSAGGQIGKVVAARILPGTDFIEGIKQICQDNGVRYAALGCSIGTLRKATFSVLVPKEDSKIGAGYGEPFVVEGPVEILSAQGFVGEKEDGEMDIHLHAVLCNKDGQFIGGHMVAGENPVLATIELVVTELQDVKLMRLYDAETGLLMFTPLKGK